MNEGKILRLESIRTVHLILRSSLKEYLVGQKHKICKICYIISWRWVSTVIIFCEVEDSLEEQPKQDLP